jgi:choline dehydrogenase-like flavoprotein
MGADPKTTVVSPTGETHDVKNLYVADASLLPTSIGYNPSETVYALAHYINDQILKAHRPEWVIDARNDVSRVPAWVFESPVG